MKKHPDNKTGGAVRRRLAPKTRLAIEDYAMLVVALSLVTVYANWAWLSDDYGMSAYIPPFAPGYNRMEQTHLGAECFNVAESITQGHGFSNPFGERTGPTGWVSPMLSYWMACGLWLVGGSRDALTELFFAMQILVLALTGTICLAVGRRMQSTSLAIVAMVIVICTNFKWMFQITHDCVFQMLWVDIIFLGLWHFPWPCWRVAGLFGWGSVGGLCALAGPAAGGAWAVGTTIRWMTGSGRSCENVSHLPSGKSISPDTIWMRLRGIAIVGVVSLCVVSPWMLYQSWRLGKFVPIKSNSAFELYQGQCVVPDGLVVDMSFMLHPYHASSQEGKRYREIGETGYLAEKQKAARQSIQTHPAEYLRRVGNRFFASTLWFQSEMRQDAERYYFPVLRGLAMLPFLGFVLLAGHQLTVRSVIAAERFEFIGGEEFDWVFPAALCYAAYLMPYWCVSYYERYGVGVSLPRMLFVLGLFVLLKRGLEQWSRGRKTISV